MYETAFKRHSFTMQIATRKWNSCRIIATRNNLIFPRSSCSMQLQYTRWQVCIVNLTKLNAIQTLRALRSNNIEQWISSFKCRMLFTLSPPLCRNQSFPLTFLFRNSCIVPRCSFFFSSPSFCAWLMYMHYTNNRRIWPGNSRPRNWNRFMRRIAAQRIELAFWYYTQITYGWLKYCM